MISESRAEKAVEFIRDHAEQIGQLLGQCKALDHKRKIVRGQAFLEVETGSVAEREAKAETSEEYSAVVQEIQNTWAEWKTLETRLRAAELTYEAWRSQNKWGNRGA
jgi:hypothetical protein